MPRFFVPSTAVIGDELVIVGEDARHIARSLRMAVGDALTVCDDRGIQYDCRLVRIRDEEVVCAVQATCEGRGESPASITLYMAYPKGDKLETVIQKAVELGASRIVPFVSSRCVKLPKAEKAEQKRMRLQRIAEEAAKQCGRSRLPVVSDPMSFEEMLQDGAAAQLALFCYEGEQAQSMKAVLGRCPSPRTVAVVVGAEGGFSDGEAQAARAAGFSSIHLGARILRCETAPAFVLSALSYALELDDAMS